MAGSVNKVTLLGHLGKDPEVRNFANGGKVVSLRLATSESWKDREGTRQERTEWHSVSIFNEKLGEIAERFLRKGSKVYIEGKLETRKWQDQAGQDRYSTEVVLRNFGGEITLLDGKGENPDAEPAARPAQQRAQPAGQRTRTPGEYPEPQGRSGGAKTGYMDDSIPFGPEVR